MSNRLTVLYQKLKQSIVSIEGMKKKRIKREQTPFFLTPFSLLEEPEEKKLSYGSGMIISPKGYILTCNHVVHEMTNIKVKIGTDQSVYQARLVWANPRKDVALFKLPRKKNYSLFVFLFLLRLQ